MATPSKTERIETAREHARKGEHDLAEKAYRAALAQDSKDEGALLGLAALYTKLGKKPEAIEQCERVADLYVERGRDVKAVEVYARVLRLDPGRAEAHAKLGELLHRLHRPKEAMSEFRSAAAAYRQRNHGDDNLPTLRRILELTPEQERSGARVELAEALARAGHIKDALIEFREEARLLEAVAELEIMGNRGSQKGGHAHHLLIGVLQRIVSLEPKDLPSILRLARFQLAGAPARALSSLQQALRMDRYNLGALKLLDNAFLALGQTDKAALSFDQIVKIDPSYGLRRKPDTAVLGRELRDIDVLLEKDLPHKAMESARMLVGAHPDSFDARLKLKDLFLRISDNEGAVIELSVVISLALESGEVTFARAVLQEALKLSPSHPRVREGCVQVAEKLYLSI